MVGAQLHPGPAAGRAPGRLDRDPQRHGGAPHRRHRWGWADVSTHLRLPRSIVGTLVRLDDDPVLLCDCAEGSPHTCS